MKNAIVASFMLAFFFNSINSGNASNSVLSTGTWYKLSASETGIYVITYNDLLAYGIPVSTIDPRNISLYGNSPGEVPLLNSAPRPNDLQEMAIEVKGESDGVFDVGDTIFFYNHSQMTWQQDTASSRFHHIPNHYSESVFFFLKVGTAPGKRISDQQSLPSFSNTTTTYTEHAVHESELINLLRTGKEWYGEHFNSTSESVRTFPIMINDLTNGDSILINFNFVGRGTLGQPSTITMSIGSNSFTTQMNPVGGSLQDNYGTIANTSCVVFAPLGSDSLTFTFQSSDLNAEGWLNYIEVNAIRNLNFDQSPMSFRDSRRTGLGQILKHVLTANSGIKIWDVTSFNEIKNQLYILNSPQIFFNAAADSLKEYIAFGGSNYFQPNFIGTVSNQNLHSIVQKNMIIVSDKDFVNEAVSLAQYHQTVDNLSTAVVSSEQVFNEYSSGSQDPVAIRDFIRQVYHSASTSSDSLKYVLLFGSASYDYKNILGFGQSVMPTYESSNSINLTQSFCSDDFYTFLDSAEGRFETNEIPDLAIGRIPVKTTQDAQVVNKIMGYSSNSSMGMWRTKVTSVADDQDGNYWVRLMDTISNRIENFDCGLNINKIYIDAFTQHHDSITNLDTYPEARQRLEESFQEGSFVIEYIGHGGSQGWATERVLEYGFLDTVNNITNLPVIVAATASFNEIDDPSQTSAGSASVTNPNGGSIASISPTRVTFGSSVNNFTVKLNEKLFERSSNQRPTIGDVFFRTKQFMHIDPFTYSFVLLGDPASRIVLPENEIVVTSFSPDTISPWQPVQISGEVHDRSGALMTSFNGPLDITMFKPKTLHMTLGNDSLNLSNPGVPTPFRVWDDTLYNATVNVVNGSYSLNFIMPFNVDSGFGLGRIAFYANDGVVDAMGCYQNFVYRNLTPGIPEYSDLQIQLFPNPATDQIKCMLNNVVAKDWSYTLTGIDGRKLRSEKIVGQEFFIERNSLASGVYFLKIVDAKGKVVRVEKIVFE